MSVLIELTDQDFAKLLESEWSGVIVRAAARAAASHGSDVPEASIVQSFMEYMARVPVGPRGSEPAPAAPVPGVKPCKKCGTADRYKDGRCKQCSRARNTVSLRAARAKLKAHVEVVP